VRFDNPIFKHNFTKPLDIASFKDLKDEYRQTKDIDCSYLRKYFKSNNFKSFNEELKNIIQLSYKEKKKNSRENKYFVQWKEKLDRYFHFYQNFHINSKKINNNQCFDDLFKNGFHFYEIPKKKIDFLKKDLSRIIKKLNENPKILKPGTQNYDRQITLDKKWNNHLNRIYNQEGLLEGIRAYYNKPQMKVERVVLMITTEKDRSPYLFLQDCKTKPKHTNLHTDPLEGYMSSIIYLSEVKDHSGGTQFFPKSHRYIYDDLQDLFARSLNTGNYCHNQTARSVIFRLPKFLRVTKMWGRLVNSGSKIEKYLDKNMVKFISKKNGNCSIFEAGSILHNAMVKKGSRVALQVLFN